ncbi:tail fiber domain-containing protein [Shouchella sp. 1P09AA]|uniref:phage tail protein n=1 Tax=unclassified Shouchella TaxID=2893065 RepID=UPI0039A06BE9
MNEIYLLNQHDYLVAAIGEESGLISAVFREELNQLPNEPLRLTVQSTSEVTQFVKEENQIAFRDKEGELRLYVIKEVDDLFSGQDRQTYAICEPAFMELKEHVVKEKSFTNANAQSVLNHVLTGTRWRGKVEIELGNRSMNLSLVTSVDAVWDILRFWGGEIKDVVTFSDNRVTERIIKILPRRGQYSGKRFEVNHDIQEIQRTVLSYPVTALYGQGASSDDEQTDFTEVVWELKNGDPVDKPRGQSWVGDRDALEKYGRLHNGELLHREGVFSNSDIDNPKELLRATWEQLQIAKQPEVHYQLTVQLLEQLSGYEHEKVSLGDTALAFDRIFTRPIEIQARVIAIEYDLMDVNRSATVEMGQFLSAHSYDDRLDQVIREINDNRGKWSQGNKPISPDRYPDILPDVPANVEATGGFQTVQIYWAFNIEAFYVQAYELFASEVKGFLPSPETLVYRGSLNGFNLIGETNKTYYFRVRAVNYHGRASNYSAEVEGSTARIVTEDILFGPDLAKKLRELNKEATIIGNDGIQFEQIANDALELIQKRAKDYSDQEIADVYSILSEELEKRVDHADFTREMERINSDIEANQKELAEKENQLKEDIGKVGEELTKIEEHVTTEFEKVDGRLSATLSKGEVDELLTDKVDYTTYNQKMTSINASLEGIEINVGETSGQVDQLTGEVADLRDISSELSLSTEGFTTSIRQLQNEKRPSTNFAIGTYKTFVRSNWTNISNQVVRVYDVSDRVLEKEVTISCKIKVKDIKAGSNGSPRLMLQWFENNPNAWHTVHSITNLSENREIDVIQTRQVNPDTTSIRLQLRADFIASGTVEISELMVTEGKRAAGWSPAFEDLIDAESYTERQTSLDSTLEGITGKVEETTNDVGTLTNTVGQFRQDLEGFSTSISEVRKNLDNKVDTSIYEQRQTSLNVALGEITGKMEATTSDLGTLTNAVSGFRQDLNGFSTSVGEIRKSLDNKVNTSAYNQRQTSLDATLGSISGRVSSTENGLGSVTSRVGKLELSENEFRTEISHLNKAPSSGTNLLPDGSFESGGVGWRKSGSSVTIVTNDSKSGRNALRYAASSGISAFNVESPIIVKPHSTLLISYWYKTSSDANGTSNNQKLRFGGLDGSHVTSTGWDGPRTNWTQIQREWVVPANITEVLVSMTTNHTRGWVMIDDIQVIDITDKKALEAQLISQQTAIEQNASEIRLRATRTSVDNLTGRVSNAESSIRTMSDRINLRVEKDGIISAINISPESVRISGSIIRITGQTLIDSAVIKRANIENGAVGSLAIADAAISRAKLQNAIIQNAHIQDGTIQNAKIANISADKINAGTITGINIRGTNIFGSTIRSDNGNDRVTVNGGYIQLTNNTGDYVRFSPTNIISYESNGRVRFEANRTVVSSSALSTTFENVYLASTNEARVVDRRDIPGDGAMASYRYLPIRADGFIGNFINTNTGGSSGVHMYVRPAGNGEVRITASMTTNNYRDLACRDIRANTMRVNGGNNLYLAPGPDSEVRVTSAAFFNSGSPNYRDIRVLRLHEASSREYKTDIKPYGDKVLNHINELKLMTYYMKADIEAGVKNPSLMVGLIAEDSPYVNTEDGLGINSSKLNYVTLKATQELNIKLEDTVDRVSFLELENQLLKQKIMQLEERML